MNPYQPMAPPGVQTLYTADGTPVYAQVHQQQPQQQQTAGAPPAQPSTPVQQQPQYSLVPSIVQPQQQPQPQQQQTYIMASSGLVAATPLTFQQQPVQHQQQMVYVMMPNGTLSQASVVPPQPQPQHMQQFTAGTVFYASVSQQPQASFPLQPHQQFHLQQQQTPPQHQLHCQLQPISAVPPPPPPPTQARMQARPHGTPTGLVPATGSIYLPQTNMPSVMRRGSSASASGSGYFSSGQRGRSGDLGLANRNSITSGHGSHGSRRSDAERGIPEMPVNHNTICRHYLSGRCNRKKCRFSHVVDTESLTFFQEHPSALNSATNSAHNSATSAHSGEAENDSVAAFECFASSMPSALAASATWTGEAPSPQPTADNAIMPTAAADPTANPADMTDLTRDNITEANDENTHTSRTTDTENSKSNPNVGGDTTATMAGAVVPLSVDGVAPVLSAIKHTYDGLTEVADRYLTDSESDES